MSALTRLGDWMLSKALGTTEAAAASTACRYPIGSCGYCQSDDHWVSCSSCYYDSCTGKTIRYNCRRTGHLC